MQSTSSSQIITCTCSTDNKGDFEVKRRRPWFITEYYYYFCRRSIIRFSSWWQNNDAGNKHSSRIINVKELGALVTSEKGFTTETRTQWHIWRRKYFWTTRSNQSILRISLTSWNRSVSAIKIALMNVVKRLLYKKTRNFWLTGLLLHP